MNTRIQKGQSSRLPAWEFWPLMLAFKVGSVTLSDRRALKIVVRETNEIQQVIEDATGQDVFEQTRISRLFGIRQASCQWSVMMVIEHLCMINQDAIKIIDSLARGITPQGRIEIDDYLPDPAVGWETLDRYREIMDNYSATVSQYPDLRTGSTFEHPWFGQLDAHQWHCFVGFHQLIHRRQARKIVAVLGVA